MTTPQSAPELESAALLGEMARPVLHECNNFLNNLLMQIALLEEGASETMRADLAVLKNQGIQLAALVGEWQGFRKPNPTGPMEIDAAAILAETTRDLARDFNELDSAFTIDGILPLRVPSQPGSFRRLSYFLLADAVLATANQPGARRIVISAECGDSPCIRIDDNRTNLDEAVLSNWFDVGEQPRPRRLMLAACGSLAYRCGARLRAERSPLGGVRVTVTFAEKT